MTDRIRLIRGQVVHERICERCEGCGCLDCEEEGSSRGYVQDFACPCAECVRKLAALPPSPLESQAKEAA